MAELFRFPPAQIGTGLSHIPEPVGYTEDDVRLVVTELAAFAFDTIGPEASKSRAREALDKFPEMVRALLDGGKDNG